MMFLISIMGLLSFV